jgi:predicted esterase
MQARRTPCPNPLVEILNPSATVHGRVLVDRVSEPLGAIVGFHGYAQTAEDMLEELRRIPGADSWTRISIQALHPFYIRGDSRVVASWMTRQDRDLAIADNIAYVQGAVALACNAQPPSNPAAQLPSIYVGFSQGAAMAYRAALHSPVPAAGIIALAGDIPPELKSDESVTWPPVLIGVGDREEWYAGEKLNADVEFLQSKGIHHDVVRFPGGHEWTDEFRVSAGRMLTRV